MKEVKPKKNILKIEEVACFDCAIYQNAVNIANALAQAGRFVNIITISGTYSVRVYERAKK